MDGKQTLRDVVGWSVQEGVDVAVCGGISCVVQEEGPTLYERNAFFSLNARTVNAVRTRDAELSMPIYY